MVGWLVGWLAQMLLSNAKDNIAYDDEQLANKSRYVLECPDCVGQWSRSKTGGAGDQPGQTRPNQTRASLRGQAEQRDPAVS
ncbi:hypothetical protein T07_1451 [Trichinella nelsoni]|uniref:Uncharacterized protein n=1 Tax=Trichinella nelsoni TaxID=6336 RepID=A0A0V0RKZ5_9BILA|nr:hypothetical protein T07_1451 [Trichinella nelsoni]